MDKTSASDMNQILPGYEALSEVYTLQTARKLVISNIINSNFDLSAADNSDASNEKLVEDFVDNCNELRNLISFQCDSSPDIHDVGHLQLNQSVNEEIQRSKLHLNKIREEQSRVNTEIALLKQRLEYESKESEKLIVTEYELPDFINSNLEAESLTKISMDNSQIQKVEKATQQ